MGELICYGDFVRVKKTKETEKIGLAGQEGVVSGLSSTDVVECFGGKSTDDLVFKVDIDGTSYWMCHDALMFVDCSNRAKSAQKNLFGTY